MIATSIPYLYTRKTTYYFRKGSTWRSLRTSDRLTAIKKTYALLAGIVDVESQTGTTKNISSVAPSATSSSNIKRLPIESYFEENKHRWGIQQQGTIKKALSYLPKFAPDKRKAIALKQELLKDKSIATVNRYIKFYNALYKWLMANDADIELNPFANLQIQLTSKPVSSQRKAYDDAEIKRLMSWSKTFSKDDKRFWLVHIARYTGMRISEICQLKPDDISKDVIHIRGENLKTSNSLRTIPMHKKLIEVGILNWVNNCTGDRLFHEWGVVKGSYGRTAGKWFSNNKPIKDRDFHAIRHTVATELKASGIPSQYSAQILGHANGNITYDRYGKQITNDSLINAMSSIGC